MKTFKLFLRSLINNEAAVEGGRTRPWWLAIIMIFVSLILSLIPTLVTSLKKDGSDFINGSYVYGYDVAMEAFIKDTNEKDLHLVVKESETGKYLDLDKATWDAAYPTTNTYGMNRYAHLNSNNTIDFEVYYVDEIITQEHLDHITKAIVEEDKTENRAVSFVLFGKTTYISSLYSLTSTTAKGTVYCDYKYFDVDYDFTTMCNVKIGDKEVTPLTVDRSNAKEYRSYCLAYWNSIKGVYSIGFKQNKFTSLWQTLLLMFGINLGITIFMGLMIFILTRGKNNPFRIYTFWETQKIAYWAAPAPTVIAMILGFFLSSFATVTYPLVMGLRIMWLSMRTLRPENATPVTTQDVKKDEPKEVKVKSVKQ